MSAVFDDNNFIDVICQHTNDGNIIPLRIRIKDEDNIFQTFNIKGYKELSSPGKYVSPYGTISHGHIWIFLCNIQVLDTQRKIELLYNSNENLWRMSKIF